MGSREGRPSRLWSQKYRKVAYPGAYPAVLRVSLSVVLLTSSHFRFAEGVVSAEQFSAQVTACIDQFC